MINTVQFKETMETLNTQINQVKQMIEAKDIDTTSVSENENIEELIKKSKDVSFKLLVMGRFSSGKSAFVNVLLGEKILPEKALPTTALITEIYYGEEKRVVMYPRPGKWEGGDEPFEIEPTLKEIARYSTINNKAGLNTKEANRVDSTFEKMEVYWPLEMLKDGVSIIDSPGTDDPYQNDYIVEAYVPKVDAILYCVNGTTPYCMKDKQTLDVLNSRGFNPMIVTTYFDVVSENLDEDEKQDFIESTLIHYARHTKRECCHYVNSRLGLEAKRMKSHEALLESGYYELENFLGKYLTEEKGKDKINGVVKQLEVYTQNKIKTINEIVHALELDDDKYSDNVIAKNEALKNAKLKGEHILRKYRIEVDEHKSAIEELAPTLYTQLYHSVNLDDFKPNTDFMIFHPKECSKLIAEECSKEIEIRSKEIIHNWIQMVLMPKVKECFKDIFLKLEADSLDYEKSIKSASFSLPTSKKTVQTGVSDVTRVSMLVYGVITGDWITALTGGIFGAGAFGRAMICQFAAFYVAIYLGLISIAGLPALILAVLAGTFLGVKWNSSKVAENIKKKTVEQVRDSVYKEKQKLIEQVVEQSMSIFDDMAKQLKKAMDDDIKEAKENMEKSKMERVKYLEKNGERKDDLKTLVANLEDILVKVEKYKVK